MKVICLSCGHKVDLGDAYDDFEGLVKCFACRAVLAIKTDTGTLKSVLLGAAAAAVQSEPRSEYQRVMAPMSRPAQEQS